MIIELGGDSITVSEVITLSSELRMSIKQVWSLYLSVSYDISGSSCVFDKISNAIS